MSRATSSCPHCGKTVLDTDKFCIFCGKPLKKINFTEKSGPAFGFGDSDPVEPEIPKKEEKGKKTPDKETDDAKQKDKSKDKDKEKDKEKDKGKSKKGKDGEEDEEDDEDETDSVLTEVPEQVKNQMKVKIRLLDIADKKKKLKTKLEELMKEMKGDRYSKDYDFMMEVNARLKAIQNIKTELEEEEAKFQAELGGEFKIEELERIMKEKDEQLTQLTKTYRMRKIEEDIFKQLKKEYAAEYKDAEKELKALRKGLVRWVQEIKGQRARVETDLKVAKGRSISKEISKEEYDKIEEEKLTELNNLDKMIKYVEIYAYNKKISWF